MFPRTADQEFGIQMQVHQNKELAQILHSHAQNRKLKSIKLKPGHEYTIEIRPIGRKSTEGFRLLSKHDRKCQLDYELHDNSIFKIYSKANCRYECAISLAYGICHCTPWDFLHGEQNSTAEICDVFGRKCFQIAFNNITKNGNECKHCVRECDMMEFETSILGEKYLSSEKNPYINYEYVICTI